MQSICVDRKKNGVGKGSGGGGDGGKGVGRGENTNRHMTTPSQMLPPKDLYRLMIWSLPCLKFGPLDHLRDISW